MLLTRFRGLFDREPAPRGPTGDLDGPARGRAPVGRFDPSHSQRRELVGSAEVAAAQAARSEILRLEDARKPLVVARGLLEAERATARLAVHWAQQKLLALGEAPDVAEVEATLQEAEGRTGAGVLAAVRARLTRDTRKERPA